MKKSTLLVLALVIIAAGCALPSFSAPAAFGGMTGTQKGNTGGGPSIWNRQGYAGSLKPVQGQAPSDEGGAAETQDQEQPLEDTDLAKASGGKSAIGDAQTSLPGSGIKMKWPKGVSEAMKRNMANTDGRFATNSETQLYLANFASTLASGMNAPDKQMHAAKANLDAQGMEVANAMADLEKQQAATAIDFCSSFLTNFTSEQGNKWNKLRDKVFVPMAILLLLPGAVLTQVKSIVSAGFPVLGDSSPFEGIQRAIVAIFLIPGTYLVLNYAIDLNNSITYSIAQEYNRLFNSDMYKDAISFHIRAFPSRQPGENRNALDQQTAQMTPLLGGKTAFALFEGKMLENKIEDPIAKIYQAPKDRADEALPSSAIAAKTMFNSSNATFMIAWNILCAFQMVYFYYLWFVGPITAALWAWPMSQLRGAFPSWVEGVITLGFWSLFWNTSILLMACFRGVDETGTLILTALNFLATSSVKYAFDFAGLAKAAGQEAASMAEKAMKSAQAGGGGGGGKGGHGGGSHSRKGGSLSTSSHAARAHHASGTGAGLAAAGGSHGGAHDSHHQGSSHLAAASAHKSQTSSSLVRNASLGDGESASLELASLSAKPDTPLKSFDAGDVAPPPSAEKMHNAVISHQPGQDTFTLGDFTLKRGQGEDNLLDADGNVVAAVRPAELADGQHHKVDFAGGSLSYERSANTELFTLADGKHTEQIAFLHANPNAEMQPVINDGHNQVALPMASGDSLLLSQDGNSLSYTNSEGDITDIDLSSNGMVQLSDGSVVSVNAFDNGADVSVSNSNKELTDCFSLIHNANGSISVGHADGHGNALGMINFSAANGTMIASSYDESGRFYQKDALSDNAIRTEYFDPRNAQHILGASETHYGANGDHTTNFFNSDNALVASSQFQHLANGGTMEVMRDASNNVVSSQQTMPYGDGYAMQSCNYTDGSLTNSSLSFYDQDGNVVSDVDQSYLASYAISSLADYGVNQSTVVDNDYNSNTAAPVYGNYAAPAGTEPVHVASQSAGAGQINAMNDLLKGSVVADARGVHPDGGVFSQTVGHTQGAHGTVHAAAQPVEANSSYNTAPQVLESRSVQALPVDIAGTQMPGAQQALQTEFSQVHGAYAQTGEAQQGYTAYVAYSSPVVSSSVDVVPPAVGYDPTPIADQFCTTDDVTTSSASLEQVCASNAGDLVAALKESAQAVYGAPAAPAAHEVHPVPPQAAEHAVAHHAEVQHNPAHQEVQTAAYAHSANNVYEAPATKTNVLPVDIAGTQMPAAQALQTEFSQVHGAYAQTGEAQQGYTAYVAYSSPVVSSSVDVVPPVVGYDPTPIADQFFTTDDVTKSSASLEQVCASNAGDLVAAPAESAHAVYGAPSVQSAHEIHAASQSADQGTASHYAVSQSGEQSVAGHHAASQDGYAAAQYASVSVSDGQASSAVHCASTIYEASGSSTTNVLPVDIAGTQLNSSQSLQTEFSPVQGTYAQSGDAQQGYTAHVAYSSPVVSSSVDVVPPTITYDPAPIADRSLVMGYDTVSSASLEQVCAGNVGALVAAPTETGHAVYGAPAGPDPEVVHAVAPQTGEHPFEAHPAATCDIQFAPHDVNATQQDVQSSYSNLNVCRQEAQHANDQELNSARYACAANSVYESPQATTHVLPVDIAGVQLSTENQTEFTQVQGAYAQTGDAQQGYTSHVAYSSPIVSSSVEVVPPALTYEATPGADQNFQTDNAIANNNAPLEQVCASNVGDLVAAPRETVQAVYAAPSAATNQEIQNLAPASAIAAETAPQGMQIDVARHEFLSMQIDVARHECQSMQIDAAHRQAQYASYCSNILAVTAAQQANQNATVQNQSPSPKRGLSSLFQEIDADRLTGEAEKRAVKPPVVNPAAQANPKLPHDYHGRAKEQGRQLTGKMASALAKPSAPIDTTPATTGQCLEQQMLETRRSKSAAPNSALNAVLGRAGSMSVQARRSQENLNNALADYQVICSLLREGKVNEAKMISNLALRNLANCTENDPQYLPLVRAYIDMFRSRNMNEQVEAFTARAGSSLDATASSQKPSNVWGS